MVIGAEIDPKTGEPMVVSTEPKCCGIVFSGALIRAFTTRTVAITPTIPAIAIII